MTASEFLVEDDGCLAADARQDKWQRYSDFFRGSAYAVFPQRHRGLDGQMPFRMIEVDQNDHGFSDPNVPETVLALPLATSSNNGWSWNMGDGWKHDRAAPGTMLILPEGTESRWRVVGRRKLLLLALPSETMSQVSPDGFDQTRTSLHILAQRTWRDEFIERLTLRLWEASCLAQTTDRLLADSILIALVLQLLQRASLDVMREERVKLPAWRLRRVTEFVDSHLDAQLSISLLATAAGLSERHFTRAFRQEVGETPHRWVMRRRIERARHMLENSEMSLQRIAEECGFLAISHFGRVFKDFTDETPKRWQERCRRTKV